MFKRYSASKQPVIRESLYVLLVGQSGTGKSTWINSFVNYLKYESLSSAKKENVYVAIPTKVSIDSKVYTFDSTEGESFKLEANEKENQEWGVSSTQTCMTYKIRTNRCDIHFIDTPGLGDTRGIQYDRKNIKIILDHLRYTQELHAILVLLKPNEGRVTPLFKFCIKEILTHIHKNASHNIFFCYTNATMTAFRHGDTTATLKRVLTESGITGVQEDYFFVDNECFRYLCLRGRNIKFTKEEKNRMASSWSKSYKEMKMLIEKIKTKRPHQLQDTKTLNETRLIILTIKNSLINIARNIDDDVSAIEEKKGEIEKFEGDSEQLANMSSFKQTSYTILLYKHPRTVCQSKECLIINKTDNGVMSGQRRTCHEICYLEGIVSDELPDRRIKQCKMFQTDNCKHCGCSWTKHVNIFYNIKVSVIVIRDPLIEIEVKKLQDSLEKRRKMVAVLEQRVSELKKEQQTILHNCAVFAHFLRESAVLPYNDSTVEYIDCFIELEHSCSNFSKVESLKLLKKDYEESFERLKEYSNQDQKEKILSVDRVRSLIEDMYKLPHSGQQIKNAAESFYGFQNECARNLVKDINITNISL